MPLLCLSLALAPLRAVAHVHTTPFQLGDEVKLECRRNLTSFPTLFTETLPPRVLPPGAAAPSQAAHGAVASAADDALWGPGPLCHEHGRELSFKFGQDGFVYCGLHVGSEEMYRFVAALVRGEESWSCRVAMSADRGFYLPLQLPLWGVAEEEHLHINHHMAFVFHVDAGRIIGAAAYPVRDRFQLTRVRSTLSLHGPVHWFQGHGYLPLLGAGGAMDAGGAGSAGGSDDDCVGTLGLMFWCLSTAMFTLTFAAGLYVMRLKPMLAQKYLKKD